MLETQPLPWQGGDHPLSGGGFCGLVYVLNPEAGSQDSPSQEREGGLFVVWTNTPLNAPTLGDRKIWGYLRMWCIL